MKKELKVLQMKMPKNIKEFENKWVAMDLKREKVVASGKNIKEVDEKAEKLTKDPAGYILSRIPDFKHTYSP